MQYENVEPKEKEKHQHLYTKYILNASVQARNVRPKPLTNIESAKINQAGPVAVPSEDQLLRKMGPGAFESMNLSTRATSLFFDHQIQQFIDAQLVQHNLRCANKYSII